ncbi:MAG TPA: hypothetical protein VKB16_08180, partial [Beijerinckiaceae bacterium]|nr:hypothetical protein [Beijerinckiaceae bacterium]
MLKSEIRLFRWTSRRPELSSLAKPLHSETAGEPMRSLGYAPSPAARIAELVRPLQALREKPMELL